MLLPGRSCERLAFWPAGQPAASRTLPAIQVGPPARTSLFGTRFMRQCQQSALRPRLLCTLMNALYLLPLLTSRGLPIITSLSRQHGEKKRCAFFSHPPALFQLFTAASTKAGLVRFKTSKHSLLSLFLSCVFRSCDSSNVTPPRPECVPSAVAADVRERTRRTGHELT